MDVRKFPRQEKSAYKTLKYPGIDGKVFCFYDY